MSSHYPKNSSMHFFGYLATIAAHFLPSFKPLFLVALPKIAAVNSQRLQTSRQSTTRSTPPNAQPSEPLKKIPLTPFFFTALPVQAKPTFISSFALARSPKTSPSYYLSPKSRSLPSSFAIFNNTSKTSLSSIPISPNHFAISFGKRF